MSNDLLQKLSNELKEARTKKKISIDQIFTKTRIDKKYLTAIEEGNFGVMPEVYIRAFIKEYSKNVGLNSDEILEKYSKAKQGIDYSENAEPKENIVAEKSEQIKAAIFDVSKAENSDQPVETNSKSNKTFAQVLIGLVMLISIFVIYQLFLTENNREIITEKPFNEIVEQQSGKVVDEVESTIDEPKEIQNDQPKEKIEPKKVEEKKITKVKSDPIIPTLALDPNKLNLTIVGSDKSWIRAVVDDTDNSEFIIDNGINKVLTADSKFYLHIGNSGGVKLLLNNKDIFFSGAPGKVRKIYVTKDGIEYLRRTPQLNAEQTTN